ncbi:hypothetical protein RND81_03G092300 [Saponaria officinalis]|uniref:Uncharacterized protein n=1 Tax=Saponaria officinalis TaxID=3572 RepID=A0AAW1LZ98_SAPOF
MLPRVRKFDSGSEKRKKKKRIEELVRSHRGALDKFLIKESVNEVVNNFDDIGDDVPVEDKNDDNKIDKDGVDENIDNVRINKDISTDVDEIDCEVNKEKYNDIEDVSDIPNMIDIFDPRKWDSLDSHMIEILAVKGPRRDLSIEKGPKGIESRRFNIKWYTRTLPNGEKCDRD